LNGSSLPMPWQEFVEVGCRVIGDAAEYVGEPCLRVDVIELGGADQRVHHSGTLATAVGPGEQPGFAADRNAAQRAPQRCC